MVDKILKDSRKRQKIDRERALRVVKYIDYPFVLDDSPVELEEGYIVSDKDTYDVFASFIFKNVGARPIKALSIRLACYQNQNIPYEYVNFTYSPDDLTYGIISVKGKDLKLRDSNKRKCINQSENFGSCVYVPLPESYFKRLEVYITEIEYSNGEKEVLNLRVAGDSKRYSELDNISKLAYSRVNIYVSAEEQFPTKVIPQFAKKVWLCCCGTKNPIDLCQCEKCGREKDWQEKSVSASALEKTKQKFVSDPTERVFHDKSNYVQNKYLESDADVQKKIEQYEKAMENVAREEQRRERNKMMILPKLIIWGISVYGLAWIINWAVDKFL